MSPKLVVCASFTKPLLISHTLPWLSPTAIQTRNLHFKRLARLEAEAFKLDWADPLIERAQQKKENPEGPKEPHKLHVVYRTKKLSGRPHWEKDIMSKLGLAEVGGRTPIILKNTPSINKLLKEVKHLVKIQALKFPHGLPEDPSDFQHSYINSKGEYIVKRRLNVNEKDIDSEEEREKWRLDIETVNKSLKRKLQLYEVSSEFHQTHYEWKMNEDGKEYRYNFNKNIRKYKF